MSVATPVITPSLIPAKAAAALVPYSRDYIARIAREGKIAAVQIDRQWFVEETSLRNFYEQSLIEDEVRKRHLSHTRKRELEVKETYTTRLDQLETKRAAGPRQTAILAVLMVLAGVSSGLLFLNSNPGLYLARVPGAQLATVVSVSPTIQVPEKTFEEFNEHTEVLETSRPLSLRGGIVLLPTTAATGSVDVGELFSDQVTVTLISTSTGVISVDQQGTTTQLPFVRIPAEARAKIITPKVTP